MLKQYDERITRIKRHLSMLLNNACESTGDRYFEIADTLDKLLKLNKLKQNFSAEQLIEFTELLHNEATQVISAAEDFLNSQPNILESQIIFLQETIDKLKAIRG